MGLMLQLLLNIDATSKALIAGQQIKLPLDLINSTSDSEFTPSRANMLMND